MCRADGTPAAKEANEEEEEEDDEDVMAEKRFEFESFVTVWRRPDAPPPPRLLAAARRIFLWRSLPRRVADHVEERSARRTAQRFASDHIITTYVELLDGYNDQSPAVNRMIVRFMHRLFVRLNLQGFFYKVRCLPPGGPAESTN